MIRNQWYVVLSSAQVKSQPVGVTRMGEKLVFWRDAAGKVGCLRDQCVHRRAQLSKGKVLDDGRLQCPFHGFEYDTSGRVQVIPANGRQAAVAERFRAASYPTYEAHDLIWIWWGENPPEGLAPPRFFSDVDDTWVYGQVLDRWQAHYSRVIENQLDVAHLPFVHYNTIGRGNRTLVDGPGVEWVHDDEMHVFAYNKVDDGSTPLRPDQVPIPNPRSEFKLELIMPNLWQNHFGGGTCLIVAFVPVDDTHTILYLRFYGRLHIPRALGKLLLTLAAPVNLIITHQDRRVVVTQEPKRSELRGGEGLIQADRPIVEYRRKREALKEQANQHN